MARGIKDATDVELEEELERRKKASNPIPTPLQDPDYTALRTMIIQGVRDFDEKGYQGEDFRQYVYEAAVEAIYGKDYWTWHNNVYKR